MEFIVKTNHGSAQRARERYQGLLCFFSHLEVERFLASVPHPSIWAVVNLDSYQPGTMEARLLSGISVLVNRSAKRGGDGMVHFALASLQECTVESF
jgi:hypothetical protein